MRRRPHSPLATRTPSVGPCFVATRLEVFADLQHGRSHRFFESTVAREPVESIEHLARLACANLTITSHALDLFGADKNVRRLIRFLVGDMSRKRTPKCPCKNGRAAGREREWYAGE